jgi:hypothetical protein
VIDIVSSELSIEADVPIEEPNDNVYGSVDGVWNVVKDRFLAEVESVNLFRLLRCRERHKSQVNRSKMINEAIK